MVISKGRRNLTLVFVSFCIGMLFFVPYIRFSFYDQTLSVFGINNAQMGLLGSVYGAVAIPGYFFSGILANRIEPKILIAVSCFATGLITFWLAAIPSFSALIVIYILYSVFSICTLWSPYLVIIRELGEEDEQGRLFGISDSLRNVFSVLAGFLFVFIFGMFANDVSGYKGMLFISVGIYMVFGVLSLLILPTLHLQKTEKSAPASKDSRVTVMDTLRLPGVWLMGIFIFACYSAIITQTNYLGTFSTVILGFDENVSSALAVTRNYLLPILAGVIGGYIVDKAKNRIVAFIVLLTLLAGLCIATMVTAVTPAVCNILTMFLAIVAIMILATYWSMMSDCGIPESHTAIATGIVSCICYLPDAFITIIIGRWLDADLVSGFKKMFLWIFFWSIVAVFMAIIILVRKKKTIQ